jgi:secreted PhoX family phosphatase
MTESRRRFLQKSTALTGAALLAPSLQGLVACSRGVAAAAGESANGATAGAPPGVRFAGRGEGGYGELRHAGPELMLPEGFSYTVVSVSGRPMSDGNPTPIAFDGMAAFALPNGNVRLIRNHEVRDRAGVAKVFGDPATAYDPTAGGGTTSLELRFGADGRPELVRDFVSLNGTLINCAGGPTPWGSWLTCEETAEGAHYGWQKEHGYIFEVPAAAERPVEPVPLKAMGRFVHEAVAVDPATGIVYETEDRLIAGFYRFLPKERGVLRAGGTLQMLAVAGRPNLDTADGMQVGAEMPVTWVDIRRPDVGTAWGEDNAVFAQGFTRGGARFARLEGCWYGGARDRAVYFHGIVICEDSFDDAHHLRGLTKDGRIFDLATNVANGTEFAGACFSPDGGTLFVNIMGTTLSSSREQGMTLAIRGPWTEGAL